MLVYPWPWRSRTFDLLKIANELSLRNHTMVALIPDNLLQDSKDMLNRIRHSSGEPALFSPWTLSRA